MTETVEITLEITPDMAHKLRHYVESRKLEENKELKFRYIVGELLSQLADKEFSNLGRTGKYFAEVV